MFAEILKELRINKGVPQKAVAEYLDMTPNAYRKYEYGEREPSLEILIKLCKYFQVSADFLLGIIDKSERDKIIENKKFIKEIKDIRTGLGLTEQRIAEKLGISESEYKDYENGNKITDIEIEKMILSAIKKLYAEDWPLVFNDGAGHSKIIETNTNMKLKRYENEYGLTPEIED